MKTFFFLSFSHEQRSGEGRKANRQSTKRQNHRARLLSICRLSTRVDAFAEGGDRHLPTKALMARVPVGQIHCGLFGPRAFSRVR
jgi:hypothetical protein